MRCPHCRSEIRALKRPEECPHCGRPQRTDAGHAIRPMDGNFDELFAELDQRSKQHLKVGTIAITCVSAVGLLGLVFPPIAWLPPIAIVVMQFVYARPVIAGPYARHFSTGRRILTRWVSRLFVVTAASLHVGGILPGTQVLISPPLFLAVCATSWGYHRFHLRREHRRQPVHFLEKVLLVVLALLFLTLVTGVVLVVLVLNSVIGGSPN